jgi:hypothetical protein
VELHRLVADPEGARDLGVGGASRDHPQDLDLPLGEPEVVAPPRAGRRERQRGGEVPRPGAVADHCGRPGGEGGARRSGGGVGRHDDHDVEQPGVRAETLEPTELVGAAGPDDEERRLQPLDQLGGLVRIGRVDDRSLDTVERAADRPTPVRIVVENNDVQVRRIVRREDPPYRAIAAGLKLTRDLSGVNG